MLQHKKASIYEIQEYFTYVTKAPDSVKRSFFDFVDKVLGKMNVYDLSDFYFNFEQSSYDSTTFLREIFGLYYLGNATILVSVLKSIEEEDQDYYTFKKESLMSKLSKTDKALIEINKANESLEKNSEQYRRNLEEEIFRLERKKSILRQLDELESNQLNN